MSVNENNFYEEYDIELSNQNINQMIEFSSLIPGLCQAMAPRLGPNNPWSSVDLRKYPQHLLGIVPNPDFFACPQSTHPIAIPGYSRILHSPKSHPSTPIRK